MGPFGGSNLSKNFKFGSREQSGAFDGMVSHCQETCPVKCITSRGTRTSIRAGEGARLKQFQTKRRAAERGEASEWEAVDRLNVEVTMGNR
jgi:hypothetical protein